MLSTPPAMKSEPRPAARRSCAVVIASKPDAQLRCTVTAGTCCGMPARKAMTRAIFAVSGGWQTQPKITSSSAAGSSPVRVSNASVAMRPSSSAATPASALPALQKGVRIPARMARREDMEFQWAASALRAREWVWSVSSAGRSGKGGNAGAVIDHAVFLELRADALLAAQFLHGMKFDAVGMDLQFGSEAILQQRAQRRSG